MQGNVFQISRQYLTPTDLLNVIVLIRATDHMITMLCHVTNNCGWQNISGSIDTN